MIRKRRRQQLKNKNKPKKYFIILLITICSVIIISNDFGLMKLIKLKQNQFQLQKNIHVFVEQQTKLNEEIIELKTNINYIEQIAREKFMMASPGEKIFKVVDYKQIK